ncbi:MAG: HlyD family efflux transporter periplasmic adaptor subunit [Bacteroidota bacterium]
MSARTLFILLSFPMLLWQCSSSEETTNAKEAPDAPEAQTVAKKEVLTTYQTIKAKPEDVGRSISLTGRLQALESINIVAEVQGRALPTGQLFNEGVRYQKGELMVNIDKEQFVIELMAQKSQFKSAIVRLMSQIKLDHPKAYPAWEQYLNGFDEKEPLADLPADTSQSLSYFLSANNIPASFYQIKAREEQLEKFQVRAPFPGVLTQASLSPGAVVSPGTPLGQFSRTDVYEFKSSVSAADIDLIKPGQQLQLIHKGTGKNWKGRVHRIGSTIDPATQAVPVFVRIQGKGLRSGLFLESSIEQGGHQQVVRLPNHSLTRSQEVRLIEDSTVQLRAVEVVEYRQDDIFVKGLTEGDLVIIEKIDSPIAGQRALAR